MAYLLVVRLGTQINQIGCDAGEESFAISATSALFRLHEILVQFVDGRFEGLAIDLIRLGRIRV